jgi:xanthine/uracil permease
VDDPLAMFDKIYDKPWTRLGPYLVGMIVGWILYKTDCKIKMSKVSAADVAVTSNNSRCMASEPSFLFPHTCL